MAQRELKHKAALHPCVEARQSSDLPHVPQPAINNQTSDPQLPEGEALSLRKAECQSVPQSLLGHRMGMQIQTRPSALR